MPQVSRCALPKHQPQYVLCFFSKATAKSSAKHPTSDCARTPPKNDPNTGASRAPAQTCSIGYERSHAVKQLRVALPGGCSSRARVASSEARVSTRPQVVPPQLDVLQLLHENFILRVVSESQRTPSLSGLRDASSSKTPRLELDGGRPVNFSAERLQTKSVQCAKECQTPLRRDHD